MRKIRKPGRPATGQALTAAERMRRYRARRKAAGLRPVTKWVAREPLPQLYSSHRVLEARSLAMHVLAVRKIARDPALLGRARRTLQRWRARYPDGGPAALTEWARLLARPWPEVAALATAQTEEAARLRQSSPLATLLTQAERKRVYEAFRT